MAFTAPVKDQLFCMKELAGIDKIAQIPGFEDAGYETAQAVLEESAKFNEGVVAPLNWSGDQDHGSWDNGVVRASKGFKEAYAALAEGGWQGLGQPAEYGGQGLPKIIGAACVEQTMAANLSFSLCSILTGGAIEALLTAGSDELKTRYIPNMVAGKWTGTMNLTEPQAGSDLALVRSKAVKQDDGTYRISGQKIFITYGEHDMAENIIHLVLARGQGAPEGVKGISLFVVPKFMVKDDGTLGERNDVHCVSIEHKMGIKASPTAVLQYGDHGGAVGYLVGEENRGLACMFTMMNAARLATAMQGVSSGERATQQAFDYARDRKQVDEFAAGLTPGELGDLVKIVRRIRADGIDVLVDMKGYTANGRPGIFAFRPAPVQITWLGFPGTTGLDAITYRITDALADPPGASDRQFSEQCGGIRAADHEDLLSAACPAHRDRSGRRDRLRPGLHRPPGHDALLRPGSDNQYRLAAVVCTAGDRTDLQACR